MIIFITVIWLLFSAVVLFLMCASSKLFKQDFIDVYEGLFKSCVKRVVDTNEMSKEKQRLCDAIAANAKYITLVDNQRKICSYDVSGIEIIAWPKIKSLSVNGFDMSKYWDVISPLLKESDERKLKEDINETINRIGSPF
jgi:hypothetical protein